MQLRDSQDAPVSICFCCQSDLKRAMSFRRLCIKTQKKWKPHVEISDTSLSEQESPVPSPRAENHQTHTYTGVSTYRESDSDDEPLHTVQVLLKECQTNNCEGSNLVEEEDHLDQNYIIKATTDIDTDDSENIKAEVKGNIEKHELPSQLSHSSDGCKQLLKAKQEATIYICELCGTHANSKVSFERHMRKHTGERPFGCK